MTRKKYSFGARSEIKPNRSAMSPVWIIGGILLLLTILLIGSIVLIVRKIRRTRKQKNIPS